MSRPRLVSGDEALRTKRELRERLVARRASLTAEERHRRSLDAADTLMSSPVWRSGGGVAIFHSMADEIETSPLLQALWQARRPVALPVAPPLGNPLMFRWVTQHTPLFRSRYGALEPDSRAEPADLSTLDLLVVPGLGFDSRGARLGYGGGYYDRTLAATRGTASVVMLSFACQQVDQVPEEPHDQRVNAVVTELGWAVQAGYPCEGPGPLTDRRL